MREVDETLLDGLAAGQGVAIKRVHTWADLAAYKAGPTAPEASWDVVKFDIFSTSAKCVLVSSNDYTVSDFTVFSIVRGLVLGGVEYTIESGVYFVRKFVERDARIELEGSSYPDEKISLTADGTYLQVIEAFCTAIGKTAVFDDPAAAWLGYQFMATGESLVMNRAERFEQIIRQKYLILCYERSPLEMVFYSPVEGLSDWKGAAFADSRFVAVADGGGYRAATSTDGLAWTGRSSPIWAKALAYSSALDRWVAVGDGVCATSSDGVTWTARTMPAGDWQSVAWDATIAKFVAVGYGLSAYSSDGVSWTRVMFGSWVSASATSAVNWWSVCWSPALELFAAVGDAAIMTSPDGITWTARTSGAYLNWSSVVWDEHYERFVAVASSGSSRAVYSSDGITWTTVTGVANSWRSVCAGIMGRDGDTGLPYYSFVAVSSDGTYRVMTSEGGVSWTTRTAAEANSWRSVCWSPELELFVAVSSDGTNRVMTSPNGISWTARSAPAKEWYSVCWSSALGLFVAGCSDSTNGIMTSPDGITWTLRSPGISGYWNSVAWFARLGVFVALSTTGALMYSFDGVNWIQGTAAEANGWRGICACDDLNRFVAVSSSGTNRVMHWTALDYAVASSGGGLFASVGASVCYTSANATTWTARTIPAGTYYAVGYKSSLYVAVGANVCATSTNGTSWTSRTISAGTWRAVTWASALSLWIAVGDGGKIATSPDGTTWTARTSPTAGDWRAVAWSGTRLVALSSTGMIESTDGVTWRVVSSWIDHEFDYADGPNSSIIHGTAAVHFVWRDESDVIHTEGNTDDPAWGLGYLESMDEPPALLVDPFYKLWLQLVPVRLDVTDGDRIHFNARWELDPAYPFEPFVTVSEHFDASRSPSWWQELTSIALFDGVEGGGLPASVERSGAYIPLISSGFDGNLDQTVTNLQALAEWLDDMPISGGGYTPPATTAANDVQVGDGAGAWIKKTLAEFVTILRSALDAVYQAAGSYIASSRTISTTAPLTGGGDLSANRTLAISAATTGAAGSMSAADKSKLDGVAASADVTASALPGAIHGATAGTTIADSDEFPFWLAASSALRRITGANIKAWLKAYFDGLYAPIAATQSATISNNAAQSIGNGTWTNVAFNVDVSDPEGWHDPVTNNSRVYVPEGEYQVILQNLTFASNATGIRGVKVWDSDANQWGENDVPALSGMATPCNLVVQRVVVGTGKYLYCQAYQSSGGALNVSAYPKLTVNRVG
ncbi:MAG: WD40 repeat domain-containing protein [Chloroflexi bacterium]|nr:WD40 repeat domain-containing protein [Chloroflexota bacterium]